MVSGRPTRARGRRSWTSIAGECELEVMGGRLCLPTSICSLRLLNHCSFNTHHTRDRSIAGDGYGGPAEVNAFAHGVMADTDRPTEVVILTADMEATTVDVQKVQPDEHYRRRGGAMPRSGNPERLYLLRWYNFYWQLFPSALTTRSSPPPLLPGLISIPHRRPRPPREDSSGDERGLVGDLRKRARVRADAYAGTDPAYLRGSVLGAELAAARQPEMAHPVQSRREREMFLVLAQEYKEDYARMADAWNAVVVGVSLEKGRDGMCSEGACASVCLELLNPFLYINGHTSNTTTRTSCGAIGRSGGTPTTSASPTLASFAYTRTAS